MDTTPETTVGEVPVPRVRAIGAVNWLGLWTLYAREVKRFLSIYLQTLVAPMVSTLLFLAIFTLALGRSVEVIGGVPFARFLAPGLVMMALIQNAFANTSSSLVLSKITKSIVDVLMPPLTPAELACGYALAGATRGMMVAVAVAVAMSVFLPMRVHAPLAVVFYAVAASLMISLMGLMVGIWADKFDHSQAITNFVIMPLSFLSGTFYSIDRLPEPFYTITQYNPFFYMIDGFRFGFTGHADGSLVIGAAVLLAMVGALGLANWRLLRIGYKLKT